jgi:hypothetical protein
MVESVEAIEREQKICASEGLKKVVNLTLLTVVEGLIIERLIVVELLKYFFSLMSTLDYEVNRFHVELK